MKLFLSLLVLLTVNCSLLTVAKAADAIQNPGSVVSRLAALEASTNVNALLAAHSNEWIKAGTDAISATGRVAVVEGLTNSWIKAASDGITATNLVTCRADTNVTSDATLYTPKKIGDILTGGAGAGTTAVWIAKGTTTNDWLAVRP